LGSEERAPEPIDGSGVEGRAPGSGLWTVVQATIVLLVVAFFLFSLRDLLSPFLLFWVLLVVLLPFRGARGWGLWVTTAAVLTLFWILARTGFLMAPFVLAVVLAYLLDPVVDRMERARIPRWAAIVLLMLPVAGALAAVILWGIPALSDQIQSLVRQVPQLIQRFAGWLEGLENRMARWDVPFFQNQVWLERLRNINSSDVVAFLEARREAIAGDVWSGVLGVGRGLGTALTVAGYVVLTPVLGFFLLRDWDPLVARMKSLLPHRSRESVLAFAREYDDLLSRYLRGQLLVALTVGTITALGLWITGFPYAFLLGAIVAVFNIVPYLGLLMSLIPAVGIALASGQVLVSLLKIVVVYGVAQGLDGTVISPRVVGGAVELHPVWVMLALALGGFFFGFVGLLVAVPGAVGIKLLVLRGLERYRNSPFFREAAAGDE